jgi:hypothetical protein
VRLTNSKNENIPVLISLTNPEVPMDCESSEVKEEVVSDTGNGLSD